MKNTTQTLSTYLISNQIGNKGRLKITLSNWRGKVKSNWSKKIAQWLIAINHPFKSSKII